MSLPINSKMKFYVTSSEEFVTFGEYVTSQARKFSKLTEGIIKSVCMAVKQGEDPEVEVEGKMANTQLKEFTIEAKADFKAHAKNKAKAEAASIEAAQAKKVEKEGQAKAKEESINESIALLDSGLSNKKLVTATSQLTASADKQITAVLPTGISLDASGLLTVADGLDKKVFASAFAGLVKMSEVSGVIGDRSAKTEAQLALAAKTALGEDWVNFFKNKPADISRIQKGMKTVSVCAGTKAGMRVFLALPLSTTRALTELKVTTKELEGGNQKAADEKNLKAKQEVLKRADLKMKELAEKGVELTQVIAKNLVSEYKKELGLEGKVKFKVVYGIVNEGVIQLVGGFKLDPDMLSLALFAVDTNCNKLILKKDGSVDAEPVDGPDEDILAKLADMQADREAEKKKASKKKSKKDKVEKEAKPKKAPKKSKIEDDEEDEEEAEEDEEEEEEIKPAKKAAAKKPAAKVEEEEDEEEEDEEEEEADEEEEEADEEDEEADEEDEEDEE